MLPIRSLPWSSILSPWLASASAEDLRTRSGSSVMERSKRFYFSPVLTPSCLAWPSAVSSSALRELCSSMRTNRRSGCHRSHQSRERSEVLLPSQRDRRGHGGWHDLHQVLDLRCKRCVAVSVLVVEPSREEVRQQCAVRQRAPPPRRCAVVDRGASWFVRSRRRGKEV